MKIEEVDQNQLTNVMQQYYNIKQKYLKDIVIFQLGDFYEMFFQDAIEVAQLLGLMLTGKKGGLKEKIPMCGLPVNSLNDYLKKLINHDYNIVLVDQVENNELGKKLVDRKVTKIVTKGTYLADTMDNNFIGSVISFDNKYIFSYGDVATGEIYTIEDLNLTNLENHLLSNNIREIVVQEDHEITFSEKVIQSGLNFKQIKNLSSDDIIKKIETKIQIDNDAELNLMIYLYHTEIGKIEQFKNFIKISNELYMHLPFNTQNQLELIKSINSNEDNNSLFKHLNKTSTAIGRRYLKKIILQPLLNKEKIIARQNIIENFIKNPILIDEIKNELDNIYDFERLIGKIIHNSITPKEIEKLKNSLKYLPKIKKTLQENNEIFKELKLNKFDPLIDLFKYLDKLIIEDAPNISKNGDFIKSGFNEKIDEFRKIKYNSQLVLAEFEKKEIEKTKIKNLKIKYNKIFGYFIEVTNSYLDLVPDNYVRKQTMSGCERFITEELKIEENKILNATETLQILEIEEFNKAKIFLKDYILKIQKSSKFIAKIDVFINLAVISIENNYIRPTFNEDKLILSDARHPIVEKKVQNYIKNEVELTQERGLLILTGPNMAGKSTYMRMIGLISIMAQIGSNVPAKEATLKIFDSIYTRIGSSDNISEGKSTFMVEMLESREAIDYATKDSLLIFDELGRGTSTYDGIALAQAIINYIVDNIGCITLFSTHYHELVENTLTYKEKKIKIAHVRAEEEEHNLKFYHKVLEGSTSKSYGIKVAKLAGINDLIIENAEYEFNMLDKNKLNFKNKEKYISPQLQIKNYNNEIIDKIKKKDLNSMTPIEAINFLTTLKKDIKNYDK